MAVGCGTNAPPMERHQGQSEFESAPPGGQSNTGARASDNAGAADAGAASADAGGAPGTGTGSTRQVEETDIYRVDGNRLYYLNSYRGLMVFDITDVDHPRLLGRAPIFGTPVEMLVRDGVAYAIVADWYGTDAAGVPFHGSVVRAIDARDPANIRVTSEDALDGWVRDARVVGNVLYAVSEDDGWDYYFTDDVSTVHTPSVVVSAVNIANPAAVHTTGSRTWPGYSGIFNVTQNAIILVHNADGSGGYTGSGATEVDYVDISDPDGAIAVRGSFRVNGNVQGWGANNGRFNVDFDGRYIRTLGVSYNYAGGADETHYVLSTVDATNPDALTLTNETDLAGTGWIPAARFANARMYLSPANGYWYGSGDPNTPVQIYDLQDPAHPTLAGSTTVPGAIWSFIPAGDRVFAIGNDSGAAGENSQVALRYLDVSDAANPRVLGISTFGAGWSWSPAADDFKAFTMDAARGLVVLPFSGWDDASGSYHNGVQLIEFTRDGLRTAGTAQSRGWTERGIFVGNRIYSLSDLALSVVDYADHDHPTVVSELTLARNVIDTHPMGATVAQLSSDWWGHESNSTLRVVPTSDPDDATLAPALAELHIDGVAPQAFHAGNFAYIVTTVSDSAGCSGGYWGCGHTARRVQVVDLSDPAHARLRGAVTLPFSAYYWGGDYYYEGWYGWWDGEGVVQVGGDALVFRDPYTYDGHGHYIAGQMRVVDLHNPDAPAVSSTTIVDTVDSWWGSLRAVGNSLFVTHYDWVDTTGDHPRVRYYLDRVDLTDRAHPHIASRVNVPGVFVGATPDLAQIYTMDYAWTGDHVTNSINVLDLSGDHAYLRGSVSVDGWAGNVFVRGARAYFSAQQWDTGSSRSSVTLHQIDLSNPDHPVDRASGATSGWGWLLGVEGNRAVVGSGYGEGVDLFRIADDAAPVYERFVRTRGWWGYNVSRQGDTLFLSSGYWGVQTIDLAH